MLENRAYMYSNSTLKGNQKIILEIINIKLGHLSANKITHNDYEQLFSLYKGNMLYNALFSAEPATESRILESLKKTPPNTAKSQKHFVGIFDGDKLLACLDFVEKYPNEVTVYLGLLMVDVRYKKRGLGSWLMNILTESAKESGYKIIRLACFETNTEGYPFWKKCGFLETERKITKDYGDNEKVLIIMEKELYEQIYKKNT